MAEDELLTRVLLDLDPETRRKLLMEVAVAVDRKKVATAFGSDTALTAKELRRLYQAFNTSETFTLGQLVTWKPRLKNRRRPVEGEPAIVVEVLDEPLFNEEDSMGSTYFREKMDLKLGLLDEDGDFLFFHFDSRRLTAFKEGEEEEQKE